MASRKRTSNKNSSAESCSAQLLARQRPHRTACVTTISFPAWHMFLDGTMSASVPPDDPHPCTLVHNALHIAFTSCERVAWLGYTLTLSVLYTLLSCCGVCIQVQYIPKLRFGYMSPPQYSLSGLQGLYRNSPLPRHFYGATQDRVVHNMGVLA